jgi:hypothetical protein
MDKVEKKEISDASPSVKTFKGKKVRSRHNFYSGCTRFDP